MLLTKKFSWTLQRCHFYTDEEKRDSEMGANKTRHGDRAYSTSYTNPTAAG